MIRRTATSLAALAGGTLVFLGVYGHARPGDAAFGLVVAGAALAVSRTVLPRRHPRESATGDDSGALRRDPATDSERTANPEPSPRTAPSDLGPGVLARLAATTLWSVVRDSWKISWAALHPGPPPEDAFVEILLGERHDTLVGILALLETLPPGSYLVDVDRRRGTALFHAFDAADAPDVRRRQRTGRPSASLTGASLGEEP